MEELFEIYMHLARKELIGQISSQKVLSYLVEPIIPLGIFVIITDKLLDLLIVF